MGSGDPNSPSFGDTIGQLAQTLFYMTPAGARYANARSAISMWDYRRALEEERREQRADLEQQKTQYGALEQAAQNLEADPGAAFTRLGTVPVTHAKALEHREKLRGRAATLGGQQAYFKALMSGVPVMEPTFSDAAMGVAETAPGSLRVTPGRRTAGPTREVEFSPAPPAPSFVAPYAPDRPERGGYAQPQRIAAGATPGSPLSNWPPGMPAATPFDRSGIAAVEPFGPPDTFPRRSPIETGPLTQAAPTVEVAPGVEPTTTTLPWQSGERQAGEREPTTQEVRGRLAGLRPEFQSGALGELYKSLPLLKEMDRTRGGDEGAAIVNAAVTQFTQEGVRLRQGGDGDRAGMVESIAQGLRGNAAAASNPKAAREAVMLARQQYGALPKGPKLEAATIQKLVGLFGQKPGYTDDEVRQAQAALADDAGWDVLAKRHTPEIVTILQGDLKIQRPQDVTGDALSRARQLQQQGRSVVAGASAGAVEAARLAVPNPMDVESGKVWRGLTNAMGVLDHMTGLIGSGRVSLSRIAGGIKPWVNEIVQSGKIGPFPVPEGLLPSYSSEERQFLALLNDYADLVLRQRSGAQINEQEFKRMLSFLANEQVRPEVIIDRLGLQDRRLEREMGSLEQLLKSQRMIVPSRQPRQGLRPDELKELEHLRRLQQQEDARRGNRR